MAKLALTTTSAPKMRRNSTCNPHGFTLLEIMVSMAIVSIIVAAAALFITSHGDSELDKVALQTQVLAKQTLQQAKQQERPYSIYISDKKLWSRPESAYADNDSAAVSTIEFPADTQVSILSGASKSWVTLKKNEPPFVWAFAQSGLCDPIQIRLETDSGVQTLAFHPLTAGEITDAD